MIVEEKFQGTEKKKDTYESVIFKELVGHKKRVYTLDWNVNGSKLASGSVDSNIRV